MPCASCGSLLLRLGGGELFASILLCFYGMLEECEMEPLQFNWFARHCGCTIL